MLPQSGQQQPYRLWIDTLCCPVELEGKHAALERIKDVYENATHVLVLDSSTMQFELSKMTSIEALLRIYVCSIWMTRLWTLQGLSYKY
jgi:hypothetical protein